MTRLDKALIALTKAMGSRPFVLVYNQTHKDAECAYPKLLYHNGFVEAMGLVKFANWKIEQTLHEGASTREEPK